MSVNANPMVLGNAVSLVAWVADVHVGNHAVCGGASRAGINERCALILQTLAHAVREANRVGAHHFVVLGDLFDSNRPSPQVIAATGAVLRAFDGRVILLRGNHDMSSTMAGDTALAPLGLLERAIQVESPQVLSRGAALDLVLVPFQPGAAAEWLPGAVAEAAAGCGELGGILGLHLGILDAETAAGAPWLAGAADAVRCELLAQICNAHGIGGIGTVLAGNWHRRRRLIVSGVEMLQVGALCPTGWDNPGLEGYGTLALTDGAGRLECLELPGPRFVDLTVGAALPQAAGHALYVRVRARAEETAAEHARLSAAESRGEIRGFRIVPDADEVAEKVAQAGSVARALLGLEAAVGEHCRRMKLEDETLREEVTSAVRRYLL